MKPIKIEDITPEKLQEIEDFAQGVKLHQLTLDQLRKLSNAREDAIIYLSQVELDCKLRAMRAHTLGFSKKELAKIFNVTANTIKKWIG